MMMEGGRAGVGIAPLLAVVVGVVLLTTALDAVLDAMLGVTPGVVVGIPLGVALTASLDAMLIVMLAMMLTVITTVIVKVMVLFMPALVPAAAPVVRLVVRSGALVVVFQGPDDLAEFSFETTSPTNPMIMMILIIFLVLGVEIETEMLFGRVIEIEMSSLQVVINTFSDILGPLRFATAPVAGSDPGGMDGAWYTALTAEVMAPDAV
jgi:hypothetical protein